jgi:hypothetical protein
MTASGRNQPVVKTRNRPPMQVEPDDPVRLCGASLRIRVVRKFQMFTPDESLNLCYDLLNSG